MLSHILIAGGTCEQETEVAIDAGKRCSKAPRLTLRLGLGLGLEVGVRVGVRVRVIVIVRVGLGSSNVRYRAMQSHLILYVMRFIHNYLEMFNINIGRCWGHVPVMRGMCSTEGDE